MSPHVATLCCLAGIGGLFYLDRDEQARTSPWLWMPVVWIALGGSRNISVWLGGSSLTATPDQYLEGSPLDRAFLALLVVAAIGVLIARGQRTFALMKRNAPLLLFVGYCFASILWSDFPFIALKRWTKMLGNVSMVLVVLTDPNPAAAVRKFLTRGAFLLIPASVLMIKYYPELGRIYDRWEGIAYYTGATTDKNMLGCICMVFGFGILARFVESLRDTAPRRRLLATGTVLAMNLWLFHMAQSATSLACFMIGGSLIAVLTLLRQPRPWVVHTMVGGIVTVGVVAYFFQDAFALLVQSMGRNVTLTGRTDLWNDVLLLDKHPLFGAGFESFFLGDRLEFLWRKYWWHPNEAHNGYLETYLTLGMIGLSLLGLLLVTGYRNIIKLYRTEPTAGSLRLAFLVAAPIYNITEAAFKVTNPMWIMFLLVVTAAPFAAEAIDAAHELKPTAGPPQPVIITWKRPPPASGGRAGPPLSGGRAETVGAWHRRDRASSASAPGQRIRLQI
jgi:O-antigen ligase